MCCSTAAADGFLRIPSQWEASKKQQQHLAVFLPCSTLAINEHGITPITFCSFCKSESDMELMTPSSFEAANRQRRQPRSRPCDACRKHKTKCVVKDSKHGCLQCQARNSVCEYNRSPPERKQRLHRDRQVRGQSESTTHVEPGPLAPAQTTSSVLGQTQIAEAPSEPLLGLCSGRFSELYGLGSDMEPILMVSPPCQSRQH